MNADRERPAVRLAGLVATRLKKLQTTRSKHLRFQILSDAVDHDYFDVFALRLEWKEEETSQKFCYFVLLPKNELSESSCSSADALLTSWKECCSFYFSICPLLRNLPEDIDTKFRRLYDFLEGHVNDFCVLLFAPYDVASNTECLDERSRPPFAGIFETSQKSVFNTMDNQTANAVLSTVSDEIRREIVSSLVFVKYPTEKSSLDNILNTALIDCLWEQKKGWPKIIFEKSLDFLLCWWRNKCPPLSENFKEFHEIVRSEINGRYGRLESPCEVLDHLEAKLKEQRLSYIIVPGTPPMLRCSRVQQVMERQNLRYLIVTEADLKQWKRHVVEDLVKDLCEEVILYVTQFDHDLRTFVEQSKAKCRVRIVTPTRVEEICDFVNTIGECVGAWTEHMNSEEKDSWENLSLGRLRGSAKTDGPTYEFTLAALLALRATRLGLKFQLFTNVEAARPWDDLVLRIKAPHSACYFVQLKHGEAGGCVETKEFLEDGGDYSLSKYFNWFKQFHEKYNKRDVLMDQDQWILCNWKIEDFRFILFTNKKVDHKSSEVATNTQFHSTFKRIFSTSKEDTVVAFHHGEEEKKLINNKLFLEKFLPRLRVLHSQAHVDRLKGLIETEINAMYEKPLENSATYSEHYIKIFQQWAERSSLGTSITESSRHLEKVVAEDLRRRARTVAERKFFLFKEEQCTVLRNALCEFGTVHLSVEGVKSRHRVAKLVQVLDEDFSKTWTYVDEKILREFPLAALKAVHSVCDVVVIDAEKVTQQLKGLCTAVSDKQKLVLLTDSMKVKNAVLGRRTFREVKDDWALDHLVDKVQEVIMDKYLDFQGAEVRLRALEAAWPSVRLDAPGALLSALVREEAALGVAPSSEGEWLPRTLHHPTALRADVLRMRAPREHLVLSGFSHEKAQRLIRADKKDIDEGDSRWRGSLHQKRWQVDDWCTFVYGEKGTIEGHMLAAFAQACSADQSRNVHLIEKANGVLLWRASRGRSAALQQFVQPLSRCCQRPYQPLCKHEHPPQGPCSAWSERVYLLLGSPGIGKSTFLEEMALETRKNAPERWSVVVKLLQHNVLLKKMPGAQEIGIKHVVDLVTEAAGAIMSDVNSAQKAAVRAALLHSGAISVYVDGVDEIVPAYKEKALRLLELLVKQTKANKIWVASRHEVDSSLCRLLNCVPLSLLPLSRQQQIDYLTTRWTFEEGEGSAQDVERPAQELVNLFARMPNTATGGSQEVPHRLKDRIFSTLNDSLSKNMELKEILDDNKFTGIITQITKQGTADDSYVGELSLLGVPLHLKMAAEAFEENVRQALATGGKLLDGHFGLLHLFREFLKKKRLPFKERYGLTQETVKLTNVPDAENQMFQPFHTTYAILIWTVSASPRIRRPLQESALQFKKYLPKEKTGILWETEDGRVEFAHFAYVEYFVASWLFDKHQNPEDVKVHLQEAYKSKVRGMVSFFLDSMLAEGLEVHSAVLEDDTAALQRALDGERTMDELDRGGRSALHLAAYYGREEALDLLLALARPSDLERRDGLLQWTALQYADHALEMRAAERMLEKSDQSADVPRIVQAVAQDYTLLKGVIAWDLVKVYQHVLNKFPRFLQGFTVPTEFLYEVNKMSRNVQRQMTIKLSPIHEACAYGGTKVLGLLLSVGGGINTTLDDMTPLHFAAMYGKEDSVKMLLKHGAERNPKDEEGLTPLYFAAHFGHDPVAECLIGGGADVNALAKNGITPLYLASRRGRVETVRLLLAHGAQVDAVKAALPLHAAAFNGHRDVVEVLLDYGADVHSRGNMNLTALHYASQEGRTEVVEYLLSRVADLSSTADGKTMPIHLASARGHDRVVEILLANGADIHALFEDNFTPLHCSAQEGHVAVVELLLSHEANINAVSNNGATPLHLAAQEGNKQIVEILVSNGADIQCFDNNNCTPLHFSSQGGHGDVVEHLLSHGADVNITADKVMPIHSAALKGHARVVEILLENGADINSPGKNNFTPLHLSASEAHVTVVDMLLQRGADVNAASSDGSTPLHLTVIMGKEQIVDILLERGADVHCRDNNNRTPLHVASENGHATLVEVLLSHGADINSAGTDETPPIHLAAASGHRQAVEILLDRGADVHSSDSSNLTPLHVASQFGQNDVVNVLLPRGADINRRDINGISPIHKASLFGHEKTVDILLTWGADIDSRDAINCTPLHYASLQSHHKIVRTLALKGGDVNALGDKALTPLHLAVNEGHVLTVATLLSVGADVNLCCSDGSSALHIAARKGHGDVARVLVSRGADIHKTAQGVRPVAAAILGGHMETALLLLELDEHSHV